jgi:hypothetical protein
MTWRVCSPPWPGRRNRVSWPERRRCGLPSAGRPPRSASPPLPGGQCGADGPGVGDEIVPAPGWPRRWSWQWLGWAASSRPTRTFCPAPFSSWPTWPSRRRPRPVPGHPPSSGQGSPRRTRPRPPASPLRGRAARPTPPGPPVRRPPRGHASRWSPGGHPAMAAPARAASPARDSRRARRRRPRLIPARRPGCRHSRARASPPDPRPGPRPTRTSPNPDRPGCIRPARACSVLMPASFPARRQTPTKNPNPQSAPVTTRRRRQGTGVTLPELRRAGRPRAWNKVALDGPPQTCSARKRARDG